VEQSWQGCDPAGPAFRSAQKWNCAARKIIPSSSAQKRSLLGLTDILVLRRSLGRNGCGVKQRDRIGVNFMHGSHGLARAEFQTNSDGEVPFDWRKESYAGCHEGSWRWRLRHIRTSQNFRFRLFKLTIEGIPSGWQKGRSALANPTEPDTLRKERIHRQSAHRPGHETN